MKNKGFTLVELLAVIAVLLILITLITPKVINQLNSSEDVTQKEQINTLINIAKIYTNQNTEKLPENNSISVITIQELKESGLINKSQILDPKTKEELTGCILIKDENNKYNYEYNEDKCNNLITVTFDPQGGQLDQTSKNVMPNETYGELPTPTREGYTFMGWNGKNLLNLEDFYVDSTYYKVTHDTIIIIKDDNTSQYKTEIRWDYLENGTKYTISGNMEGTFSGRIYAFFGLSLYYIANNNQFTKSFIYNNSDDKGRLHISQNNSNTTINVDLISDEVIIYNIQLEEGDTATPYEPYYITPSTTVVQENNHTLKAIWQAN